MQLAIALPYRSGGRLLEGLARGGNSNLVLFFMVPSKESGQPAKGRPKHSLNNCRFGDCSPVARSPFVVA